MRRYAVNKLLRKKCKDMLKRSSTAFNLFLLPLKYNVHDLTARISAEHASYLGSKRGALALLTFLSNVNKRQYR